MIHNIEIDPIKVNGQIEELKETYQEFHHEFKRIYEEYKTTTYQQYLTETNDIKPINQNLEKALDLCEIYTQELQNKNNDTIYNITNITKNYNLNTEKEELNTIAQTIANFTSFQNHLNYYNNKIQIWNTLYSQPIENPEPKTKKLQKRINKNLSQLTINNTETNNQITEFKYKIQQQYKNNKTLQNTINTKNLEEYTYFEYKKINKKQEKIKNALDDLAYHINHIEENTPIDYIVDILKNNTNWTKIQEQLINKTQQTINKNPNPQNIKKYKKQFKYQLNGTIIPDKNNLQELLKIFIKNTKKEKIKSELIITIKLYILELEDLIIKIEEFINKN